MRDELDNDLRDTDMLDEIALCSSLIIAASGSATRLSQATIDQVLGRGSAAEGDDVEGCDARGKS